MHVFLTALLEVVKHYHGKVIDIMGDGVMVFWGGREARAEDDMVKTEAVRNAGRCGLAMLKVRTGVINKIITDEKLGTEVSLGIGITFDSVVVTKIGISDSYDVKAFGDCINVASKYSKHYNRMKISKKVKELWPSSKTGKLRFIADQTGGYFVEYKVLIMGNEKITRTELDLLSTAISRIVSTEVLEKTIPDQLPLMGDLPDTNKSFCGKISVLFVDMRGSTELPEKFNTEQLVKIYRGYIRTVVQAIRYSGGVVRDFMGDGVLAVFIDDEDGKSEDKAVHAARYITTTIDKFLNPVLDQKIKHRISCGIGIHTGDVSLSKVGMKGKEQDDDAENEFGIAWIGNSTNLACKFSGAVGGGVIFISPSTYAMLSDIEGKQKWEKIEVSKGSNVLNGYIAKQYYLQIDEDIEPCVAVNDSTTVSLADELKAEYQRQLADIARRSEELGQKEQELKEKQQKLNTKALEVTRKENENCAIERALKKHEYLFYCNVLDSGHCKSAYVKAMGDSFWEDYLNKAIEVGKKIGENEHEIKQKISYALVSIYVDLEMYDKAYDFLVEQATGYAWLKLSIVQNIVKHVGYCDRLKFALYTRLVKNDLTPQNRNDFEQIKDWLVFEYKK